jgi:hypothetical protein
MRICAVKVPAMSFVDEGEVYSKKALALKERNPYLGVRRRRCAPDPQAAGQAALDG